ncbi:MAG TPA: exopolysaccharide transport family protein [Candidatus Polarisedimenticolia bacterium]|nr:exopolysaccharide transport family protein [Candidatus Polarisedimenticolia bacterium]
MTFIEKVQDRSLKDLLAVLFRHKKVILGVFVLLAGTVMAATAITPRTYRSDAKMLIKLGREHLTLDPTIARGQVVSISQSRESQINSELEIIKSRDVVGVVIDQIGVEELLGRKLSVPGGTPGERHSALRRFMDDLTLEVLKETNVITLSFRARSPELAQRVLESLIAAYETHHIKAHSRREAHAFFEDQTRRLAAELAVTEGELRDLKNVTAIGSLPEQRSILQQRIGHLEQQIQQTEAAISVSRTRIATLQALLQDLPEEVVSERTQQSPADTMRGKLYDLQMREQELLGKFKEESEPVKEIRRQIAEMAELLRKETPALTQVTTTRNAASTKASQDLVSERTSMAAAVTQARVLRSDLERANQELRDLNANEVQLAQLERRLQQQRSAYEKYASSLQDAAIGDALEKERISSLSVVQPPTFDQSPVSPRTRLNTALGIVLGMFGGIAAAFVLEFMDQTIKTHRDVEERLKVRNLVSIPLLPARAAGRPLHELPAPAPSLGDGGDGASNGSRSGLPARRDDGVHDRVAERMSDYGEDLIEQLVSSANGTFKAPCTIAVTSCRTGEGVSTVAASIAATLQMEGAERVLLVDGKAIRRSPRGHLVLPAGAVSALGKPLHEGGRTIEARSNAELLAMLKRDGGCVVLDLPPVLEKTSSVRFCSLADGVVLVVKAEATKWQVAAEAKERLLRANAHLLGVVLNQRRFHVPDWLHRRL